MTRLMRAGAGSRVALAAATALLLVVAGWIASAQRASAAPGDILVSTDGTSYVDADQAEPFAGLGRLVPGDSVQRSMWVRNNTTSDAYLRISVTELTVPLTSYPDAISLTTAVGTASRYDLFSGLTVCSALVRSMAIPAGGTVRVDFTIAMDASVPGVIAQDESATLGVGIRMRDQLAGPYPSADGCVTEPVDPPGSTGNGSGGGIGLPFTGADVVPLLGVALFSLLGGIIALLVLALRRRRSEREVES